MSGHGKTSPLVAKECEKSNLPSLVTASAWMSEQDLDSELVSDNTRAVNKRIKRDKADANVTSIGLDNPFGQSAAMRDDMPRLP